jgi:hypothetical protein
MNGITAAHNRGGMYFRARSSPTNPASSFQQDIRNFVSQLTAAWSNTLTQAQRDAWGVYSANQPLINRIGESRNPPGMAHFVRNNVPRLQGGLALADDAPTVFTLPAFTVTGVTASAATQLLSIAYTAGDAWEDDDGGLLVLVSRPQSVGINFWKGPYRFADTIEGDATPPVSPQTVAAPFVFTAGQKLFTQIRASNPDGRLSSPQRFATIAGA